MNYRLFWTFNSFYKLVQIKNKRKVWYKILCLFYWTKQGSDFTVSTLLVKRWAICSSIRSDCMLFYASRANCQNMCCLCVAVEHLLCLADCIEANFWLTFINSGFKIIMCIFTKEIKKCVYIYKIYKVKYTGTCFYTEKTFFRAINWSLREKITFQRMLWLAFASKLRVQLILCIISWMKKQGKTVIVFSA